MKEVVLQSFLLYNRDDHSSEQERGPMKKQTKVKILFAIRICLWITALVSTIVWIWYSFYLTNNNVFDPHEYATRLRPVLYPCLIISFTAVCVSFALYAESRKIRKQIRMEMPEEEAVETQK